MKKFYTAPEFVAELLLEDVLADSDLDNLGDDPASGDGYDQEDPFTPLIAD